MCVTRPQWVNQWFTWNTFTNTCHNSSADSAKPPLKLGMSNYITCFPLDVVIHPCSKLDCSLVALSKWKKPLVLQAFIALDISHVGDNKCYLAIGYDKLKITTVVISVSIANAIKTSILAPTCFHMVYLDAIVVICTMTSVRFPYIWPFY